jgi:hypothetical protein
MSTSVPAPSPATVPALASAPAASAAAPAAPIAVAGQVLLVTPGQALAARVISVQAGLVELALAGGLVTAASDLPMEPGQSLRLIVDQVAADRVTLRIAPDAGSTGTGGAAAGPGAALAEAGVPSAAASALLSALAERGAEIPTGAAAAALAARAASAGVSTPSEAAAFARLEASGLPTTRAAVVGLAQLIEGAPLGRALTTLLDAAVARVAADAVPRPASAGQAATLPPSPLAANPAAAPVAPTVSRSAAGTLVSNPAAGVAPTPLGGASNWTNGAGPIGPVAAAGSTPLTSLVDALAQIARSIEAGSVDGRPQALRHALAELGIGLEARLASGSAPDRAPLRSLLLALADHPGADPSLGRAAAGLSDALTAQSLVGPTLTAAASAGGSGGAGGQAPDGSAQNGAYLQVPLPGGGTAEVRISPDAGREQEGGGTRPRRLAFLLHLSALGPVMIDASAGTAGVDATIRVGSDEARSFLTTQAGELVDALRRSAPAAAVRVERLAGPAPERLLAPPPASGLDLRA